MKTRESSISLLAATPSRAHEDALRRFGRERSGLRIVFLPGDPSRALLKLIEAVDLFMPRAAVCLGESRSGAAGAWTMSAAARNGAPGGDPVDPSGPEALDATLPAALWAEAARRRGGAAVAGALPSDGELGALAYGLIRYVSLRGTETWFGRRPPAGLSCRAGCAEGVPDAGSGLAAVLEAAEEAAASAP